MDAELKSLKIDRSKRVKEGPSKWAMRWIVIGIVLFLIAGAAATFYKKANAPLEVSTYRVTASKPQAQAGTVVLNATGYIIAAHKIQLASKVVGKVAWIGVDKGHHVKEGQVIVRLEDDEYRAQLQQAKGQLQSLEARLAELQNGSRPEEIAVAQANLQQAEADLGNAQVQRERTRKLAADGVAAQSLLDDADARLKQAQARVNSLRKTYELVKAGPRIEQINSVKGQVEQVRGVVAFNETQLANTVIKAPVTGTILERVVERGEFVTTSFVGERGAKGYVVSLADLNDLQVELDISQNDFNKIGPRQRASIAVDAYPEKQWRGQVYEISPEANRQKATVQVKVKILNPDEVLRPEMNATVSFVSDAPAAGAAPESRGYLYIPPGAARNGAVFAVVNGRAIRREVKSSGATQQGLRIDSGLNGGEDIILNPPEELKDGASVQRKTQ
ncbi:MAG: efflux RND transporter periplasmic adaptor subunit [Acidobacteria bacterium]|nr:efflux RND transporter periplasmic adaptor subunit [Acidobacteriota bacterium]